MIYSTLTRIAGVGLLFSVIAVSGYVLLADKNAKDTKLTESTSEALIEMDEYADAPVVKLASLSVITDYPVMDDTELTAEFGLTVEGRLKNAKQLAGAQRFNEALQVLEIAPTSDEDAYNLDYLEAQILSWSGDHGKAEQAFTKLLEVYPQDVDIAVSFGYLHLYQNNFDDAERLFTQVLDRFPDYQDAQLGLKRATAIQ